MIKLTHKLLTYELILLLRLFLQKGGKTMFFGRSAEMSTLEKLYQTDTYELLILYGRRRVGKTTLIREFSKEKKLIYFVANQETKVDALARMSQMVLEVLPEASAYIDVFENWEKLFEYMYNQAQKEKLVFVIDEYPYLVHSEPSFSSILQNQIDHRLKETNIKLILSGSSISFMEEHVLSYNSPLYGRRTAQLKLKPFTYVESSLFFPNFSQEECLLAYGIVGGIPLYLEFFSRYDSIEEAVKELILNEHGFLNGEIDGLLRQELREPSTYNSIIAAIASGYTKLNQIATYTGIENAKCSKYLTTLENIHIVKKEYPLGKETRKNAIYKIQDNLFQFWYRYVLKNRSKIEFGRIDNLYKEILKDSPNYMGRIFEQISKEYLRHLIREGKVDFYEIGSWWGNDPVIRKQVEIDIMAFSDKQIILGECKWRNEKLNLKVYNALLEKFNIFGQDKEKIIYLFSKSGFTSEVMELANVSTYLKLIDVNALFEIRAVGSNE